MTKEEAIKILKDGELNPCVAEDREACDMAIRALARESISWAERVSTSKLDEAQRTLYYIAENMRLGGSISKEGYEHFHMAIEALKQEPKWIPVSEKLPEKEDEEYLTTDVYGNIKIKLFTHFEEDDNYFYMPPNFYFWNTYGRCWEEDKDIIAWMPLPQPYKTESEEK